MTWWDPDEDYGAEPPDLTVEITENPVVATFYDLAGDPLIEIYERATVPIGFCRADPRPDARSGGA